MRMQCHGSCGPGLGADINAAVPRANRQTLVQPTSVLILLAEDDHLVATNFLDGLEEAGYEVLHAGSGPAAIDFLTQRTTDIKALITDIRLGPGPDGWQVAHRAREVNPALPVIYASGDSADVWAANGVPSGLMLSK